MTKEEMVIEYGEDADIMMTIIMRREERLSMVEKIYCAAYKLVVHYRDYEKLIRTVLEDKACGRLRKEYRQGPLEVRLNGSEVNRFACAGKEYGVAVYIAIGELANELNLC